MKRIALGRVGVLVSLILSTACGASKDGRAPEAATSGHAEAAYRGDSVASTSPAGAAFAAQPGYPSSAAPPAAVGPSTAVAAVPSTPLATVEAPFQKESAPLVAAQRAESGQLTAGVWDDNLNGGFFRSYLSTQQGQEMHLFSMRDIEAAENAAKAKHSPAKNLDLQFVIDTTGSMGDEIEYLKREFDGIARDVEKRLGNVKPRWSLVVYRDRGDEYVTRQWDFTTDASNFRSHLRDQSAAGGGDTPEAVVQGLDAGMKQTWRANADTARVQFWVADAPTHPGEGAQFASIVRRAQTQGVHMYPIAASGTDDMAEYQMRSAAQITGGRYVFLTDDSGVGSSHAEPHIPCYNVTKLRDAIVRVVDTELSGERHEPTASQVIRRVGAPKNGTCTTKGGQLALAY